MGGVDEIAGIVTIVIFGDRTATCVWPSETSPPEPDAVHSVSLGLWGKCLKVQAID